MNRDAKVALGVGVVGGLVVLLASQASASSDGERKRGDGTSVPIGPGGSAQPRSLAELAKLVAANVKARRKDYDRKLVREFQTRAGFAPGDVDGLYGPQTAEAVRAFVDPPPAPVASGPAGWGASPSGAKGAKGAEGGVVVTGPQKRPGSPAEVRRHLGREPTDAELAEWEDYRRAQPSRAFQIEEHDRQLEADGSADRPLEDSEQDDAGNPTRSEAPAQRAPAGLLAAAKAAASKAHGQLAVAKASAQLAPTEDDAPTASTQTTAPSGASAPKLSPPTPVNLELARREAPNVAKHLRSKGKASYSRQVVRDFQAHAGIVPDGIYGPRTRSALAYFGVASPPAAFVTSKSPSAYAPP
jgi:peptidoglycan hydrolase-like protein with peptidoglycan-binding domain